MNDLQDIQNKLKEISELMGVNTKATRTKAAAKLKQISNIALTIAITMEVTNDHS